MLGNYFCHGSRCLCGVGLGLDVVVMKICRRAMEFFNHGLHGIHGMGAAALAIEFLCASMLVCLRLVIMRYLILMISATAPIPCIPCIPWLNFPSLLSLEVEL